LLLELVQQRQLEQLEQRQLQVQRQPLEQRQLQVQKQRQQLERQQLAVPSTSSSQSMRKPIQLQPLQKYCGTCVFSYERTS
jgi:hypothetical protein